MTTLANVRNSPFRNGVEAVEEGDSRLHVSPVGAAVMAEDTPRRQPMAELSVVLRRNLCANAEYLYFSDTCLRKCVKELDQMQQIIDDQQSAHSRSNNQALAHCTGFWWRHLLAGGAAGAVSRTCTAPLDRLKCMLMVYGSRTNNLRLTAVVRQMLEEGGVASLWRGNAMNIVKVVPEMALKFMVYEQIKCLLKFGSGNQRELGIAERFVAGSLAGALAQSAIYPLEVLKTRLVLRTTGQYSSAFDCAKRIFCQDGIRGFYRGFVPNVLGILPYAGIDLAVYETLKRHYLSQQSNGDAEPHTAVLLSCGIVSSSCGQLASYPLTLVRTRLQANVAMDNSGTMSGTFRAIIVSDGVAGLYRGLAANFMKVAPAVGISYVVYEKTRSLFGAKMT